MLHSRTARTARTAQRMRVESHAPSTVGNLTHAAGTGTGDGMAMAAMKIGVMVSLHSYRFRSQHRDFPIPLQHHVTAKAHASTRAGAAAMATDGSNSDEEEANFGFLPPTPAPQALVPQAPAAAVAAAAAMDMDLASDDQRRNFEDQDAIRAAAEAAARASGPRRLHAQQAAAAAATAMELAEREDALAALGDTVKALRKQLMRAHRDTQDVKAEAALIRRAVENEKGTCADSPLLLQLRECLTDRLNESVTGSGKCRRKVWPRAMVAFLSIILACELLFDEKLNNYLSSLTRLACALRCPGSLWEADGGVKCLEFISGVGYTLPLDSTIDNNELCSGIWDSPCANSEKVEERNSQTHARCDGRRNKA